MLAGIVSVTTVSAAHAQWVHKADDDPFKGRATHLALTAKSGLIAGFRCSSADDLALIYVIPEKVTDTTTKMLSAASVKLLVIVDDAPKIELDAEVQITPSGDNYRLETSVQEVQQIVEKVASAKRRFALASEFLGQSFYPTVFSVDGSRSALAKLMKGCKVAPTG